MLRELQREMALAFAESDPSGEASRALARRLGGLARAESFETIGIYQSAIRENRLAALHETFPVCAALVGEDCFRDLSRRWGSAGGCPRLRRPQGSAVVQSR